MKLKLDFYSKDEVSIQMEFDTNNPKSAKSELFMFACFTLRQFRNLGQHIVADAFAGLLLSDKDISYLLKDNPKIPCKGSLILGDVYKHKLMSQGVSSETAAEKAFVVQLKFSSDPKVDILDRDFLSKLPKIVSYRGSGKKRFEATWNPFNFEAKGFGLLGIQVNYYAGHSIIALLRFLSQKHSGDTEFENQLVRVAMSCAKAHILSAIPFDQVVYARKIIDKIDP